MDKNEIQVILDMAQQQDLNQALSSLKNLLFDELNMNWEHVDVILENYRVDRSSITAEIVLILQMLLPQAEDDFEW
tara:strand:+ start:294 stop:521 length:228 start_codon:yes stop_codon:yes gene_type:complete